MNEQMRTFKIYGASDDLVETEGLPGCDEFNVSPSDDGEGHAGSYVLSGPGGSLRIHAFYGMGGVWYFAPSLIAEDAPFPDWPIKIRGSGYTTTLEIEVPAGTVLIREARSE